MARRAQKDMFSITKEMPVRATELLLRSYWHGCNEKARDGSAVRARRNEDPHTPLGKTQTGSATADNETAVSRKN